MDMDATLPLVFSGGFPKSLYELNEAQLEKFLVYIWTFTKTAKHARVLPEANNGNRAESLRQLICALYERLGLSYLLYFSEGLAKTKGSNLYYEIDSKRNDIVVWNKRNKSIIARIPASNVCYDAFTGKIESPKKKTRRKPLKKENMGEEFFPVIDKVWSEVPIVNIELLDSDTEDPIHNGNTEVAEESIIISDSEEPVTNNKELRTVVSDPACETKSTEPLQNKNDKEVPFISRSVSVTRIFSNKQGRNKRSDVNSSSDSSLVYLTDEEDVQEIISSGSEGIRNQHLPSKKPPNRLIEEIVISDSEDATDLENKNDFLYRLGLCEPTNLPDDPIILPIPGKGDFNKFHRLPLAMIPLLVKHSLINKKSVVPGPPGQNSQYASTNDRLVCDSIVNAKRTNEKYGRYKTVDLNNCIDYKYPKKHYRGILNPSLPSKKRQLRVPSAKAYSYSKKKSIPGDYAYEIYNPAVMVEKLDVHIYLKYVNNL